METSNESSWSEIGRRAHYLCWLASAIGAAALLGLTFDHLVVLVTGGQVGIEVVVLVYLSAIVPPYVYIWRRHGESACGFLRLERALDETMNPPTLAGGSLFGQVQDLIDRIDYARGIERQLVRIEAKAWLAAHGDKLTREERNYVAEHLGYLHRW